MNSHPIIFLEDLIGKYNAKTIFLFSKYIYAPQTREDIRQNFTVKSSEINKEWVLNQLKNLKPNENISLNSKVLLDGLEMHIPMIDFDTNNIEEINVIVKTLSKEQKCDIYIFNSGRSFHGYFLTLINQEDWYKFMGNILLCNQKNSKIDIVDQRWVGHRLIAGYGTLRWSMNGEHYLQMPKLEKKISY